MKKLFLTLTAVAAIGAVAAPAAAQRWENINAHQRQLDNRIDNGVRRGCLTAREASRLRMEFRRIADIERRYRRTGGGLNAWERQDLERRLDRLNADIRRQCRDGDDRGDRWDRDPRWRDGRWRGINERQQMLEDRINRGVQRGCLTREEQLRLRQQFQRILILESRYRNSGGLSAAERRELDRQMDDLGASIRRQCNDGDWRY